MFVLIEVKLNLCNQENLIKGYLQQFQHSVPGNYSNHTRAGFGQFQPHHTHVEYKEKYTTRPETCLTTKILNKCSNVKLCLMANSAYWLAKDGEKENHAEFINFQIITLKKLGLLKHSTSNFEIS